MTFSDNELESEKRIWQFIDDNFDHNEDTTTGANPIAHPIHVMDILDISYSWKMLVTPMVLW